MHSRVSVLVLLLAIASLATAQSTFFTGQLSGLNVVPPTTTSAQGSIRECILHESKSNSPVLTCKFTHSVLNPTSAGLFLGSAGQSGTLLYSFSSGNFESIFSVNEQTFVLQDLPGGQSVASQVQALKADGWYLSISSTSFPSGEIRGQLTNTVPVGVTTGVASGVLSNTSVVPGPVVLINRTTTGTFSCSLSEVSGGIASIRCSTFHNITNVTGGGIYLGSTSSAGNLTYAFFNLQSNQTSTNEFALETQTINGISYSVQDQITLFKQGGFFIQFTSQKFPAGELRGQLNFAAPAVPSSGSAPPAPINANNLFNAPALITKSDFVSAVPAGSTPSSEVFNIKTAEVQPPPSPTTFSMTSLETYKPLTFSPAAPYGGIISTPAPQSLVPGDVSDLFSVLSPIVPQPSISPLTDVSPVSISPLSPVSPFSPLSPLTTDSTTISPAAPLVPNEAPSSLVGNKPFDQQYEYL